MVSFHRRLFSGWPGFDSTRVKGQNTGGSGFIAARKAPGSVVLDCGGSGVCSPVFGLCFRTGIGARRR